MLSEKMSWGEKGHEEGSKVIRKPQCTWVAVYAINHNVTRLFMQRTLAMSRRLDVVSDASPLVTAKTATPTKVDSELSDAHLESLER